MNNPGKFFDAKSDSDMEKFEGLSPSTTPLERESFLGINLNNNINSNCSVNTKIGIVKIISLKDY
jgi:hypothetical protein